jgi:hypothetical protein
VADHAENVEREMALYDRKVDIEKVDDVDPRVCPQCVRYFLGKSCAEWPDRVHQGDTIVVPKGAIVQTYAKREIFEAGRTYRVKINHFIGNIPRWTGESGYWTWTEDWRPDDRPK